MLQRKVDRSRSLSPHRQLRAQYRASIPHMVLPNAPARPSMAGDTDLAVKCTTSKNNVPKHTSLSALVAVPSHHRLRHVPMIDHPLMDPMIPMIVNPLHKIARPCATNLASPRYDDGTRIT